MSEDAHGTAWHEQAACRDHPELAPDVWYPTATSSDDPEARAAIEVCEACPVTAECLAYALAREDAPGTRWGIWGGLTDAQALRIGGNGVVPQQAAAATRALLHDLAQEQAA